MTVRYVCGESTSLLFGFVTDLMHIATFHRPTVRKLRNPKSHLDSVSSQVEHWNKLETQKNTGSRKCFLTFEIKTYIFF